MWPPEQALSHSVKVLRILSIRCSYKSIMYSGVWNNLGKFFFSASLRPILLFLLRLSSDFLGAIPVMRYGTGKSVFCHGSHIFYKCLYVHVSVSEWVVISLNHFSQSFLSFQNFLHEIKERQSSPLSYTFNGNNFYLLFLNI